MTLEKSAKMIVQQFGIENKKEDAKESDSLPYQVQVQFQQQYSAMIQEINKMQQANLLELEQRLGDRIDQRNKLIENDIKDRKEREERIEKRLELRDDNLMKMVREIQDAKRTIVSAQQEIAAAKKKYWWKFWV